MSTLDSGVRHRLFLCDTAGAGRVDLSYAAATRGTGWSGECVRAAARTRRLGLRTAVLEIFPPLALMHYVESAMRSNDK